MDNTANEINIGTAPGTPWRLRYWSIFIGQHLSLLGTALTQFVLMWWIADTTGSVAALANAGLAALLPQAVLAPLGGVLADRYSRRLIILIADTISALCMVVVIALFAFESVQLWHLYAMMFVRSAMSALQQPAVAASTAMLVPEHFLPRAAGLNQLLMGITTIGAAPLGALAISIFPIKWALSIDVMTALLGIMPLLVFAIPQIKNTAEERDGILTEFRQGVAVVWTSPVLLRLYGVVAAIMVAIVPTLTLVPLLIKEHFGGGPGEVAIMESLSGLGMIIGGAVIVAMAPKRRVLWMFCGFGIACLAISLTAIAPTDVFWLAVLSWTVAAAAFAMGNAPFITILQTTVPNNLQGRVLSLLNTLMGMSAPIGLIIVMPIGEFIGVRWLFVSLGVAGAVVVLLGYVSPIVRRADIYPHETVDGTKTP